MSHKQADEKNMFSGLSSGWLGLISILQSLGVTFEPEAGKRSHEPGPDEITAIMREKGIKAKLISQDDLPDCSAQRPMLVRRQSGSYWLAGDTDGQRIVVFDPLLRTTATLDMDSFFEEWNGTGVSYSKPFRIRLRDEMRRYHVEWIWPVVKKYKNVVSEILMASVFLNILGIAAPLFMQVVVDKVLVNKGESTLNMLIFILLFVNLFQTGIEILRTYLNIHTTNKIDMILSVRFIRHLLSLPLRYFEVRRVGDTMMRVGALQTIREFLSGPALTIVVDIVFSVVFIAVMLYYSLKLTLVALVFAPVVMAINWKVIPQFRRLIHEVWTSGAENNAFLVESVAGMQTIKAMAIEPQFNNRWEKQLSSYLQKTFVSAKLGLVAGNGGQLIQQLGSFAVLWVGGHFVMSGEMTIGQLIAFQMLASQATTPLFRIVGMWQSFQQTAMSLERIGDVLKTAPEIDFAGRGAMNRPDRGEIQFKAVSFRYRDGYPNAVQNLTFNILPGSRIGIVGRSGSGKSTVAKLIQGLYRPNQGEVLIDGKNILESDPLRIRRYIGVVQQENYLFSGSVRDNIAVASPGTAIADVISAARIAGAHDFILELPEGYDTDVGEQGCFLSGGQRQRIAIARALLGNPPILVLDEATSALDYPSERIVTENMERIASNRTVITIAHRLSTVRKCDYILVMDQGELVELGTHAELLANRGIYFTMHNLQQGALA